MLFFFVIYCILNSRGIIMNPDERSKIKERLDNLERMILRLPDNLSETRQEFIKDYLELRILIEGRYTKCQ